MKLNKVLISYLIPKEKEEKACWNVILKVLKKYKINCVLRKRDKITKKLCNNADLVIAAGGDGTFLRTAHFIGKTPVLGVNFNPKKKEGFLMQANKKNFEKRIKQILKNRFKILNVTRIEPKINRKKLDLALNEIFVAHKKAYKTSRLTIILKNKKEFQKSSGVIISTGAGSYAWTKSCGGKSLPLNSKKFQYLVREPCKGKLLKPKLKKGILGKNQKIKIRSEMNNCIVVMDSLSKEYSLKKGQTLTMKISNKPLKYAVFNG